MGNIALFFSFLFSAFFIIYIVLGIYIFLSAPKEHGNRVFFVLLLTLSIWSLGFSFAISAPDLYHCLFWRRLSALGWGSFFSVLLHAVLVFTDKKYILKKRWIYLCIYLPAVVSIFVFVLSNDLSSELFHLIPTHLGWINVAPNNIWSIFYNYYYILYSAISLVLIFLWGHRSSNTKQYKQSLLILCTFLLAFVLGTLTDILGNTYFHIVIPQMGPIILFIPIITIFFSTRINNIFKIVPLKTKELVFDDAAKKKVYNYLSFASVVGGFINFITQYVFSENAEIFPVTALTVGLFLFGMLTLLIQRSHLNEYQKDLICVGMIALLIPIITLQFIKFGSITVWAFPFILILGFLAFSQGILLIILSISILVTQLLVWILASTRLVEVDATDYLGRIGLFCIAICLTFYLNQLFVRRLNEVTEKMKLQELITQISSECVMINQYNFEENISHLLKMSCEFFSLDRTYICLFNDEDKTFSCIQDYCSEGTITRKDFIQHIPVDITHWRIEKLCNNELFIASDVMKLPSFANVGLDKFQLKNLKSQIMAPIVRKERVIGFCGFDSETKIIQWKDDHINYAKIVSNILGDTLTRLDTEKEINFMAHYDEVTKLPNRNLFTNFVYFNIVKQEFSKRILGIIFVDLDSFRTVNETVGHGKGDELLFMIGEKLKRILRKTDVISRFSSDEFLMMLDNLENEEEIIQIAKNIMSLFNEPFFLKGQEFFVTASAGIAIYPRDGEDAETLIMNADIAKSKSKEKGRNQYVLCSSDIKNAVNRKMQLTNHLYHAMENKELFIEYQPQVSLHTERITGVESLLRWKHPKLGMISPSVTIPLAEQTGLINPIGEWVLETACRQNKAWQDMGIAPIIMAVNISASQFKNPHFINHVEQILKKTGLEPKFLEVEITESIAIMEFNEIISKLIELRDLGVSIAIDDFGTEYSSLGRLKKLPINRIKMDKQFVDGIGHNHKDQAIANVIIELGKSLGLSVVAEGAEYEDQIAFLKTSKCDEIQGYYYYKPMLATDIEKMLKKI